MFQTKGSSPKQHAARPSAVPSGLISKLRESYFLSLVALFVLVLPGTSACFGSSVGQEPVTLKQKLAPRARVAATASVLIDPRSEEQSPLLTYIQISPGQIVADQGEVVRLSARAFGPNREHLFDVDFIWAAVDRKVGSITRDGLYEAGDTGGVYGKSISVTGIQNTPEGIKFLSEFASIKVIGDFATPQLTSVIVIPQNPTVLNEQLYRLRAFGSDQRGQLIPGVNLVWTVNDARLGRINKLGVLTVTGREGLYKEAIAVTAIWNGVRKTETTDVQVITPSKADDFLQVHALPQRFFVSPGDRMPLRAVALNGLGELVSGTNLRWEMVDSTAGTIDAKGMFVAGTRPGIYTESVRVEAVVPGEVGFVHAEDFASVVVREEEQFRRLRSVMVTPDTAVIMPNGRFAFNPKPVDEFGRAAKNVNLSWEILEPEAGALGEYGIFKSGTLSGIFPNALRVTATQTFGEEKIVASKTLDVIVTGTLTGAEVYPSVATVVPGRTIHFSIRGWDKYGSNLPGLVTRWKVTDEKIGTIDAFGNFTAGDSPGNYQNAIRAEIIQPLTDRP